MSFFFICCSTAYAHQVHVAYESMLPQEADDESDSDVEGDSDGFSSSEDDSDGGEPERSWEESDLYTMPSDGFLTDVVCDALVMVNTRSTDLFASGRY